MSNGEVFRDSGFAPRDFEVAADQLGKPVGFLEDDAVAAPIETCPMAWGSPATGLTALVAGLR
jgi:hypothetical protein